MKSPNVVLRDVEPGDLPHFFEHQRDPVAVAMVAFRSRDRAEFDVHWAKILADENCFTKTIVADGQVAGSIASFLRDGEREIGYWIDRALWGRGIATEALSLFLRLEQRRPLCAGVAPHNTASLRVLQKCGFSLSKSLPDQEPGAAGKSHIILTLTQRYTDR
ncbi:MAG TPA: GNAT family N-acetyltransferase [Chthoniobacterales bacterium]|nr:GNAT family N-acetyltransferase [Chthoniobacterales bacterium]